jgi:hypothetical protein
VRHRAHVAGRQEPARATAPTDAVDQVPEAIATAGGFRSSAPRLPWRGVGMRAHLAPGFVAAALAPRRLDAQQALLEGCCWVAPAGWSQDRDRRPRAGRGEPGARRAQQEFDAVAAGGLRRQRARTDGGGAGLVAVRTWRPRRGRRFEVGTRGVRDSRRACATSAMRTRSRQDSMQSFSGRSWVE